MTKSYKGNSLIVTVIVSLILAIICSSVILLAYYNRRVQENDDREQICRRNLQSAINLVLSDSTIYSFPESDSMDLFGENRDSVTIKKQLWGIFKLASVKAYRKNFSIEKKFFYGSSMPDYMNGCLYIADHKRPIALVGNTRLIGNAYLPESGIKSSYIDQRSFNNDKLIEGKISTSKDSLPALEEKILDHLRNLFSVNNIPHSQAVPDSMQNSFSDTAIYFFQHGKITLNNCVLRGQIIIRSDSSIDVESSAQLDNILLLAPYIHFKTAVKANVQVFATDSIVVEKDCSFVYPSALVIFKRDKSDMQNKLVIKDNNKIIGEIISICQNDDVYKNLVEIGHHTEIDGVIYTMGFLTLAGRVNGVVLSDFFIYRSPSTIYENYLVDVSIDRTRLSEYFLVPSIFQTSASQEILQWVN